MSVAHIRLDRIEDISQKHDSTKSDLDGSSSRPLVVHKMRGIETTEEHYGRPARRNRRRLVCFGATGRNMVHDPPASQRNRDQLRCARTIGHGLSCSRTAGLFRLDVERQTVVPVGQDVLPGIRCITLSSADPDLIYVGTEPAAIFVSRDGGTTWQQNAALAALGELRSWGYPPPVKPHIRDIMIDRNDPNLLHAAVQIGGVVRSEDGGQSWVEVRSDVDPDVHTIVQHPVRSATIFAVCGGGGPWPPTGPPVLPYGRPLYRSDDRGKNWTCISSDLEYSYGVPFAFGFGSTPVINRWARTRYAALLMQRPERADSALLFSEDNGISCELLLTACQFQIR